MVDKYDSKPTIALKTKSYGAIHPISEMEINFVSQRQGQNWEVCNQEIIDYQYVTNRYS